MQHVSDKRLKFYKGKAWQLCRQGYGESKHWLCERCGNPASQVHHKIYLNDANLDDASISLSWDNLELLCDACHAKEHHTGRYQTGENLSFDADGNLIFNPPKR